MNKRIVAEVSKNWIDGRGFTDDLISTQFEKIIAVNAKRGYELESWQLNRLVHSGKEIGCYGSIQVSGEVIINETIIAVFVQTEIK